MALATPSPVVLRPVSRTTARPAARPAAEARARRAGSSGHRLRLTRRGRVVLTLAVTAPIALAALLGSHSNAQAGSSAAAQVRATGTVVVQPGENLWSLARTILPQSDPREAVRRIKELNHLTSDRVEAGQQLVVPLVHEG